VRADALAVVILYLDGARSLLFLFSSSIFASRSRTICRCARILQIRRRGVLISSFPSIKQLTVIFCLHGVFVYLHLWNELTLLST